MTTSSSEPILCCPGLKILPHYPRSYSKPPTSESTKYLEFLLQQSGQSPKQDGLGLPLKIDSSKGIICVVRMGHIADMHWQVRYFAPWKNNDHTLGGLVEISKDSVEMAEFKEILEDLNMPKRDCYFGQCPNHPNLEFHAQWHTLRPRSQRISQLSNCQPRLSQQSVSSSGTLQRWNSQPNPEQIISSKQPNKRIHLQPFSGMLHRQPATRSSNPPSPHPRTPLENALLSTRNKSAAPQQPGHVGSEARIEIIKEPEDIPPVGGNTLPQSRTGAREGSDEEIPHDSKYIKRDANGDATHRFCAKEFHWKLPNSNKLKRIWEFDKLENGEWDAQCRHCRQTTLRRKKRRV